MADITIQQAYALALGIFVNPYRGGRLDGGTLLGTADGVTTCFKDNSTYLAVFPKTKNRLSRLLDGTSIDLPAIPTITGPQSLDPNDQSYTVVNTTTSVANATLQGFETPIFEPQEFSGVTRINYNYRTGADCLPTANSAIGGIEQLYHLSGLGILKKIKK